MNHPRTRGDGGVSELPGGSLQYAYRVHGEQGYGDGWDYRGMNGGEIVWGRVVEKDAMAAGMGPSYVEMHGDSPVEIYSEEKRSELR